MARFFSSSWASSREKYFFADDDDDPFMETRPLIPSKDIDTTAGANAHPESDDGSKRFQKWQPLHLSRALHGLGGLKPRLGPSLERCCLLPQAFNPCAEAKPQHAASSLQKSAGVGFALYIATATPLAATLLLSWSLRQVLLHACGVKEEIVLWFCHFLVFMSSTVVVHHVLRRRWGVVLEKGGCVSSRSLLVSSIALRGIESLVPNAKEVADFFRASFNVEPENVLVVLDVGDRLRQRRLSGKPADVSCCRLLPECTKLLKLAKKHYAAEDPIEEDAGKVEPEPHREIESSGCVILTFESTQVVHKIMSTATISMSSPRRCCGGGSRDHALYWWASPPLQFPVALGDSANRVFLRIAPEPSDINYEAFVPLRPKSSVSFISVVCMCLLAIVNAGFARLVLFLCHHVSRDVPRALLVACATALQVSMVCSWATRSRFLMLSRLHSTFTSLHRSWYVSGVVLTGASFIPAVVTSAQNMLTFERYTAASCLIIVEMTVLAFRLREGFPMCKVPTNMIALGRVYTETAFVVFATCAVAQQFPLMLLFGAIFLRCDSAVVCRDVSTMGSKRKYGPDLAFSLLRALPVAAALPLLMTTLLKPKALGIWLSSATGLICLLWTGVSHSYCFNTPKFLPNSTAKTQPTDTETDLAKPGTSISFRSDSSEQWEDQIPNGERDPDNYYVLPPW